MKSKHIEILLLLLTIILIVPDNARGQKKELLKIAGKPLYHDPVYDGSTQELQQYRSLNLNLFVDGQIVCDRDKPVFINLKPNKKKYAFAE